MNAEGVHYIVAHLNAHSATARGKEVEHLLRVIQPLMQAGTPVVLLGDLVRAVPA